MDKRDKRDYPIRDLVDRVTGQSTLRTVIEDGRYVVSPHPHSREPRRILDPGTLTKVSEYGLAVYGD